MKKLLLLLLLPLFTNAQTKEEMETPYKSIGDYPKEITSGNIISRLIDGLGYRYYWASENLSESDLDFKPDESARSCRETIEHIYDLSNSILKVHKGEALSRGKNQDFNYEDLRRKTLINLQEASKIASSLNNEQIEKLEVKFGSNSSFPYWNLINGQISDAIYHCGQIVSFRRSSGNPVNPNMNVFMGKNRS